MKSDPFYVNEIDKLIPKAEKEARAKVSFTGLKSVKTAGVKDKVTGKYQYYNHCMFTQFFHTAMKRLAIEANLRRF